MFSKTLRALVAAALMTTGLVAVSAAPAHSTVNQLTFACDAQFYQSSKNTNADMYSLNPSTGVYTVMANNGKQYDNVTGAYTTSALSSLNPIGYNVGDNYVYGVGGASSLYRIYNDGSHSASLTISGSMQTTAGDFLASDLFLTGTSSGSFSLANINATNTVAGIAPRTSVSFTDSGTSWGAFDMAYFPANHTIYGLNNNTLYEGVVNFSGSTPIGVSVSTRTLSNSGNETGSTAWTSAGAFGASYVDSSGSAYFFNNTSHNLWQIPASEMALNVTNPTATLITNAGATGSQNDGASCNSASSPLAPLVNTLAATSVTGTTATLNGEVTTQSRTGSNITSGNLKLCYSTSNTVTSGLLSSGQTCVTASPATQALTTYQTVSYALTGLTAGTTYYFQVVTTDANGLPGNGQVLSFTTPGGAQTYTVTFDANTGTGSMSSQTGSSAAALTANTFTKTGYTFAGWNTAANGTGTAYTDGQSYGFGADMTVYAQWTANPSGNHTVTFDANGGSGSMSNQTANSSTALTSNTFTRSGYTFAGWNTAANGTGTAYTDGQSYGFGADMTVYAQWTANPSGNHTVTFDANGGSGSMSNQTASSAANLTANSFSRGGYTFRSWNTAADGSGTTYSNGASYGFGADMTVYAQWDANYFLVTYDPQGGSGAPSQNFTNGATITLPPASHRDGYTFNGWFTAPTGGTQLNGTFRGGNSSVTVYAQWTANTPATSPINFNPQGGSSVDGKNYKAGDCVALPTPSRDGYTFTGWATASTGSAVANPYCPAGTGAVTLYAQWTKNAPASHSVEFNAQGGSSVANGSYTDGGCINLPTTTKAGYTLAGWATSANGTAVANPYCPANGDVHLFALWTKNADAQRGPVTVVISGFSDGKSKLTWAMKKKIDNFLKKYSDYKFIQCVGFTEGPTVLPTDKALSKARATVSCAYALAGLGQGLTAKPAKAGQETTEAAQLRRVEITLSDN